MAQEITGWTEPPTWQAPPPLRPNPRSEWNEVAEQDDRHICPHCGEPMRAHDRCRNCGRLVSSQKLSWYDDEHNWSVRFPFFMDNQHRYMMGRAGQVHQDLTEDDPDLLDFPQGDVVFGAHKGEEFEPEVHWPREIPHNPEVEQKLLAEANNHRQWFAEHGSNFKQASINEPDSASDEMQQLLDAYRKQNDTFYGTEQDAMLKNSELVPISELKKFQEFDRRPGSEHGDNPERWQTLGDHIEQNGILSPTWLNFNPRSGRAYLGEGNHRLDLAAERGYTHVPVVMYQHHHDSQYVPGVPVNIPAADKHGYLPQYMKPSDFGIESLPWDGNEHMAGPRIAGWKEAEYYDPSPIKRGRAPAPHALDIIDGHNANWHHWPKDEKTTEALLKRDSDVDRWLDYENPMDYYRDHISQLAKEHGVEWHMHGDEEAGRPRDSASNFYAFPPDNVMHTGPINNMEHYVSALHELAHCVGGTQEDHDQGAPGYGVPPYNPRRIPIDWEREYKPVNHDFDAQQGRYPTADDPSFRNAPAWELAKQEWLPDVEEHVPTTPFNEQENILETEARAWEWALQHSKARVTGPILKDSFKHLMSYANPQAISYFSPTAKKIWEDHYGAPGELDQPWEEWTSDPQKQRPLDAWLKMTPIVDRPPAPSLPVNPDGSNPWEMTGRTAAEGADHAGAMIAIYPPPDVAEKIAIKDGEPAEDLHITLAYFNDKAADREQESWDDVGEKVAEIAKSTEPLEIKIGGLARFDGEDKDPVVGTVDSPGLAELHIALKEAMEPFGGLNDEHGWNPHLTFTYAGKDDENPEVDIPFDWTAHEIVLVVGGDKTTYSLSGASEDDSKTSTALARVVALLTPTKPLYRVSGTLEDVQAALTPDLLRKEWHEKNRENPMAGHCYAASEALYHLMGGTTAGLTPMQVYHEGGSHWFLRGPEGEIIDPTHGQFETPVPYADARGRGFLTAAPSKRARTIMDRVKNKQTPFTVPGQQLPFDMGNWHEAKLSWEESQHPREQTGKFTVKHDQHEVKVHDEKGKHISTVKRCKHCDFKYAKPANHKGRMACPTCGEDPERVLRNAKVSANNAQAVADAMGWRFEGPTRKGRRVYGWTDDMGVYHTVTTGSGQHGKADDEHDAKKVRGRMNTCMSGNCITHNLGGIQQSTPETAEAGAPILFAGQEVTYGGNNYWITNTDGEMAKIYNAKGDQERVPVTELRAAGWHISEDLSEKVRDFNEGDHPDTDPNYVFVYFQGKLEVQEWDENIRYRKMAEDLVKTFGFTSIGDYEGKLDNDSTSAWVAGEVWKGDDLKFNILQLADQDTIDAAEQAVKEFFDTSWTEALSV